MNTTRLEDMFRLHDEFMAKLQRRRGRDDVTEVPELATRSQAATIESMERRLAELRKARATAIRRLDEEIDRHEKALAALRAAGDHKDTRPTTDHAGATERHEPPRRRGRQRKS
jgi:hypothetical protein